MLATITHDLARYTRSSIITHDLARYT